MVGTSRLPVRVQVYFCLVRALWPGPGGPVPVPVARSRWRGARWPGARWPGPGPGPPSCPWSCFGGPVARSRYRFGCRSRLLSRSRSALVARSRSRSRCRSRSLALPGPGGRVPVPIKRITYAVWPASSNLFQENGGSTLFSKRLVGGKQYCEVGTIIEQKQEPNGCQSQLLDMKTLDVASWAAVSVCSRNTNVTMVWAWMLS